jgi:hypothetical protein
MDIEKPSFIIYKNTILKELINQNYYLSKQDACEHIELFTTIILNYYEKDTPIQYILTEIMSYEPTIK